VPSAASKGAACGEKPKEVFLQCVCARSVETRRATCAHRWTGSEKVPRRLKEGSRSRRGGTGRPLAGRLEKAAEVAAELEEAGRDGRREVVPRQREAERDERRQAVGSGGVCHVAEGEHFAPVERHGQDSVPATLQSHVAPRGEDVHDLLCKPGVRLAIERDRVKLARAGGAKRLLEVSAHGRDAL